jgi:hypothetical protein
MVDLPSYFISTCKNAMLHRKKEDIPTAPDSKAAVI